MDKSENRFYREKPAILGDNSKGQIKAYVERIERLEETKAEAVADIAEVCKEAKSNGHDPKIIRQVVRLRKMEAEKRREQEELLALYWAAVGEV